MSIVQIWIFNCHVSRLVLKTHLQSKDLAVDDLSVQLALAFGADYPRSVKEETASDDEVDADTIPEDEAQKKVKQPKRVLTRREPFSEFKL